MTVKQLNKIIKSLGEWQNVRKRDINILMFALEKLTKLMKGMILNFNNLI